MDSKEEVHVPIKVNVIRRKEPEVIEFANTVTDLAIADVLGVPENAGYFKLRGARYLVTYKTWLDKDEVFEFFKRFSNNSDKYICHVAHESGKNDPITPYKHTHVYVNLGVSMKSTSNVRIFDINNIHPNIKPIKTGKKNDQKVINYIAKEDPDLEHLRNDDFSTLFERISACQNIREAIQKCGGDDPSKWVGIMAGYSVCKQREIKEPIALNDPLKGLSFKWQCHIWNFLTTEDWNSRQVNWIVDYKGGAGKTTFQKIFKTHYPKALILRNITNYRDIATVVESHINEFDGISHVILDLPRASLDYKMYDCLECILDCQLTVGKFRGTNLDFDNARCIIFSNWYPPYLRTQLSGDSKELNEVPYVRDMNIVNPEGSNKFTFSKNESNVSDDRWNIGLLVQGNPRPTTGRNTSGEPIMANDIEVTWVPNEAKKVIYPFEEWIGTTELRQA